MNGSRIEPMNAPPHFEELPHTADWAMRVTALDIAGLFAESARGMNALAGVNLAPGPKMHRTLSLSAPDLESLLVAFLSELLYASEQEHLAFDDFEIRVEGQTLEARMHGSPIASLNKAIKAVTYHNLHIQQTAQGYEVEIVFDV
jgi:SHS2 domain-containing protein